MPQSWLDVFGTATSEKKRRAKKQAKRASEKKGRAIKYPPGKRRTSARPPASLSEEDGKALARLREQEIATICQRACQSSAALENVCRGHLLTQGGSSSSAEMDALARESCPPGTKLGSSGSDGREWSTLEKAGIWGPVQ
jgi:hypothetical protein